MNYTYQKAMKAYLAYDNILSENKLRAILKLLHNK